MTKMLPITRLARIASLLIYVISMDLQAVSIDVLNRFPVPPGTQVGVVSEESIHNGASVSIASYQSTYSIDDTLAFYQNVWPDDEHSTLPARLESVVGNWLLISRLENGFNTVLQLDVTDTFRSTGFISVMAVNSSLPNTLNSQQHDGFKELSRTRSQDGAISSTVTVLQSNQSLRSFSDSVINQKIEEGWLLSSQRQHAGSYVVLMSRHKQRVELVFINDDQGAVLAVVNEVSNAN